MSCQKLCPNCRTGDAATGRAGKLGRWLPWPFSLFLPLCPSCHGDGLLHPVSRPNVTPGGRKISDVPPCEVSTAHNASVKRAFDILGISQEKAYLPINPEAMCCSNDYLLKSLEGFPADSLKNHLMEIIRSKGLTMNQRELIENMNFAYVKEIVAKCE